MSGHRAMIIAILETRWDSWYDWKAAIGGYVLKIRKDRLAKWGGAGVPYVPYVSEQVERIKIHLNDEPVEILWVRIKGQANISDAVVDVYYRPPDQEEEVEEANKQLEVASWSLSLVLMGNLSHPDISWISNNIDRHTVQEISAMHWR